MKALNRGLVLALALGLGACGGGGTKSFSIGGTVSGLATGQQVILGNGADSVTVVANGSFSFPLAVTVGSGYNVAVRTQPTGQTCAVSGASGSVSAAVVSIVVTCTTLTYEVNGVVTGLISPFALAVTNNGTDALTLRTNGNFAFSQKIAYGSAYAVTVATQPAGQQCSVSSGSGSVTGAVSPIRIDCVPNADFAEVPAAFPNPKPIYDYVDPIENPRGVASALYSEAIDIDGDRRHEFVMVMGKGWNNTLETRPARARVVIFRLNAANVFEDITASVLTTQNSLPGFPSDARTVDVNGDGRADVLIALNQDDGRQGGNGSVNEAPMAVLLSQGTGRYALRTFGDEKFWQAINVGRDANQRLFVMGGGGFTLPNYTYRFVDDQIIKESGIAPDVNPHIIEFFSRAGDGRSDALVGVESTNLLGVTGWIRNASGQWAVAGRLDAPFPKIGTIQIRTWNGNLATPDLLQDGSDYILGQGSGLAIGKSCQIRVTPSSAPTALSLMPRARLPEYVPGRIYDDSELLPGASLIGMRIEGGTLISANPTIINQEIAGVNANEFECKDLNADGYEDIVVHAMRRGTINSAPIIYLNRKDGTFVKSTYAETVTMAPSRYVDLQTSLMNDFDGDGLLDILIFPSSPPVPEFTTAEQFVGTMKFFKGLRPLTR